MHVMQLHICLFMHVHTFKYLTVNTSTAYKDNYLYKDAETRSHTHTQSALLL